MTTASACSPRLSGQCQCGKVRYEVEDRFEYAMYCHCSQCRRATGSAFKPFAGIGRDQLSVTTGEAWIKTFGDAQNSGRSP